MSSFFYLSGTNDKRNGVAYAQGNPRRIGDLLYEPRPVTDWTSVDFTVTSGRLCDYQPNDVPGCRLMSERLRSVLENSRTEADSLQWLPATVTDPDGTPCSYWILHFPVEQETLNKERTLYVPGTDQIMRPCFDRELTKAHQVFSYPYAALAVVVSSRVKEAITQAHCVGVDFSEALIA